LRAGLAVVGVLVLLAGAVFAGQGLGFIKGSYMTGDMTWFWIGSVMIVVGLVLGAAGLMRRPRKT
jgi:polyferredoxin